MTNVAAEPEPFYKQTDTEQDRRDIRRGSTLNLLGFAARLCVRVPFLLIAGRLYGTSLYGEYVLLTAIVETIALLSSFGLKRTIFSFLDGKPCQAACVVRHAVFVALVCSLLMMGLVQCFSGSVLSFFSALGIADKLLLLTWVIPMVAISDVCLSSILSRRLMRYEIIVRSLVEPITLLSLSLVFFAFGWAEYGLILAFLCAFGLAAAISFGLCCKLFSFRIVFGPLDLSLLVNMIRKSFYTCLHDISRVLVTRLDTFSVGYFFSTSAVGIYGMAQQFRTIVEKVALSFYPMLMPIVSDAVSAGDRNRLNSQLKSAAARLITLQFPIILTFFLFGKDLLALIDPDFISAWLILIILALGCWINSALQLVEIPLTYMSPGANLIASVSGVGVYLAIVYWMQLAFDMNGIALTSVISGGFGSALLVSMFWRRQH